MYKRQVKDCVGQFVVNDIGGQAGINWLLVFGVVVVIKLQGFALAVVVRILAITGMGNNNQAVSFKTPGQFSPHNLWRFKELKCLLSNCPDIQLVELETVCSRFLVVQNQVSGFELLLFGIPFNGLQQIARCAIVVNHGEAAAGRAIGQIVNIVDFDVLKSVHRSFPGHQGVLQVSVDF